MAKFVSLCVSFALFAVAIGSPFHSKLGKYVPFRGHDVGYHVSIQVLDWWNGIPKHSCSGTLIADRWVLTTAKCIHQSFDNLGPYSRVTIQGGDPNLQGYYTSYPYDYVLHDNADIGLMNIQQPMRESYCCSFAKLPTTPLETGDIVKGVLTGQSSNNEWKLELVEEAQFEAVDDTTCGDLLNVAPHSLCSVVQSPTTSATEPTPTSDAPVDPSTSDAPVDPSTEAPVDPSTSDSLVDPSTEAPVQALRAKYTAAPTCLADIGGPLIQDRVVVGLVSRGGCVNGQTATVLTDVSAFTDWIKSVVGEDDYFD